MGTNRKMVSIPEEMHKKIMVIAAKRQMETGKRETASSIIREAVEEYLSKMPSETSSPEEPEKKNSHTVSMDDLDLKADDTQKEHLEEKTSQKIDFSTW